MKGKVQGRAEAADIEEGKRARGQANVACRTER